MSPHTDAGSSAMDGRVVKSSRKSSSVVAGSRNCFNVLGEIASSLLSSKSYVIAPSLMASEPANNRRSVRRRRNVNRSLTNASNRGARPEGARSPFQAWRVRVAVADITTFGFNDLLGWDGPSFQMRLNPRHGWFLIRRSVHRATRHATSLCYRQP